MTTTQPAVNYFILLEINPDAPWDDADFEQKVREKRSEWSRRSSNGLGQSALLARQKLDQIKDKGYEILKDPVKREKQAQAARKELADARLEAQRKARADLQSSLEFIAPRGYIDKYQFDNICKEFSALSRQEISEQLTTLSISIRTDEEAQKTTGPSIEELNGTTFGGINEQLQVLHMTSLYEVLGFDPTASNELLFQAAETLYNDMVKRRPSPEVAAKKGLAGYAKTIFKTDDMRKRYDNSVSQRTLNAVLQDFSRAIGTNTREVISGQVQAYLNKTRAAGWDDEIALAKLDEQARERHWLLHMPPDDPSAKKLLRCGSCYHMNEPDRKFCQKCNQELLTTCPNCEAKVNPDDIGCGSCGFAVGNHYEADRRLKEFTNTSDLLIAQHLLDEAAELWHPAGSDARTEKIDEYRKKLQERFQKQQKFKQQLEELINGNRLFEARSYLTGHRNRIAGVENYQQDIEAGITQARNLFKRAQSNKSNDERVRLYSEALRICSDYSQARKLLNAIPPTPATSLQAHVSGTRVSLTWNGSPTQNVRYQIVRKTQTQPVSPDDGSRLGTVSACTYDDPQVTIGLPLYYAVFTEREGVVAPQPALLKEPLFLLQDVRDEFARVNDGQVILQWSPPDNVQNVTVIKKEGMVPRTLSDGQQLTSDNNSSLVDSDVHDERDYHYKIYCQFNNQGRLLTSPGKVVKARPEAPPHAITDLNISSESLAHGHRVHLKWQAPSKGSVVILKCEHSTGLATGKVIPVTQLQRYGTVLEGEGDALSDEWSGPGICYYIPVVSFGSTAYIGTEQPYACLEDVTHLRAENLGDILRLQWDWPTGCQEINVAYNHSGWHAGMDVTRTVTRAEYAGAGYFDIRGEETQNYFIRVTTVMLQDQRVMQSAGARIQARLARKLVLTYEIRKALFSSRRTLHIYAQTPGTVPALMLVARRDRLPARKTDGEQLWSLHDSCHIEKELKFQLPDRKYETRTFCKLYAAEDAAYNDLKIQHPDDTKLRLD